MSDNNPNANPAQRRTSITQAALSSLFQRSPSASNMPPLPGAPAMTDPRARRLSVTTVGLAGSSPTNQAGFMRRESVSTVSNSESIDESAVEDEDAAPTSARATPAAPFARRMSFGGAAATMGRYRTTCGSPGNDQQGFNWSDQIRSRAESSVAAARPTLSLGSGSPPRVSHDRSKSVSEMPAPPAQAAAMQPQQPRQQERPKPDAFQERILKGDFYMD